jgi:ATP-dependent RNA helicase DHX37/DHR1
MSDLFKYLSVIGAYEYAGGALEFCTENFIQPKVGPSLLLVFN